MCSRSTRSGDWSLMGSTSALPSRFALRCWQKAMVRVGIPRCTATGLSRLATVSAPGWSTDNLPYGTDPSGGLIVYPERAHAASPVGFSARSPEGFDLAVLEYTSWYPAPVLEPAFGYQPRQTDRLLSAGYSRGVLYFTVASYLGRNEQGQLIIDGLVSRGNSGGPVLIPGTRNVVGIVVEGTLKLTDTGEFACAPWRCEIDRPYKAVPIDWILRVVRW